MQITKKSVKPPALRRSSTTTSSAFLSRATRTAAATAFGNFGGERRAVPLDSARDKPFDAPRGATFDAARGTRVAVAAPVLVPRGLSVRSFRFAMQVVDRC